jgi:23S rRNA pseudouridine955/2504/2580 synthase/23S rRNA pseudouridine1911/1915/1917 synthase
VQGRPLQEKGSILAPLAAHPVQKGRMCVQKKGKPAHTDYEVLETWSNFSLLRLRLHTGRTHQIRVHLKTIGHPIVADPFYGSGDSLMLSSFKKRYNLSKDEEAERPLLNRLALHAAHLKFMAEDGTEINIEAPLPKDLNALVRQLNKWNKAD